MSNSSRSNPARRLRYWRADFWPRVVAGQDAALRRWLIAATLVLVALIGAADFLTGFQVSLLVFYFLPVSLAVAAAGWRFGAFIAGLSVATWLVGDFAAGAHFANLLIPAWNAEIALGTYLILIWLLHSIVALHREMDERVRQRTAALTAEIAERERLEKAVLEIGERERRSLGRDLHDGLGQHLTGTALVAQALAARLAAGHAAEAAEAHKVVTLVEDGIEQTRQVAKGLLLGEIERDSLAAALQELAATTRTATSLACQCHCAIDPLLPEVGVATHLYRIAQEAVRNAVRHGRPQRVDITLTERADGLLLQVKDDGAGLAATGERRPGLGLRIMAHRAAIIGASFSIEAPPGGGTLVSCRLPIPIPRRQ
jgi:signal transduction histidine kinase